MIGDLGSGKTTIGLLVGRELEHHTRVKFLQRSVWYYNDSQSVVRGVLALLLSSLAEEVNSVSSISEQPIR